MPCCVLRFLVFRPAPSPVSPNIAAHRQGFASVLACPADYWRVLCCVFGFLGQVWALFRLISQHTDAGLGFMLVDAHLSAPHPHPSPVAGVSFSLRPPPSPLCVLRFLVFRLAPSPVLFDIAAHRPRRDAAWMEAQVLGADAGVRGAGPGCVEARGSAGKWHIGSGRGAAGMLYGVRASRRKTLSTGNIGSIFTIDGKNNNSLGTVRRNSCQVVWHAGNLEVADNLPTPHAHT